MYIILKIPKEFEEHYNRDHFKNSLSRLDYDIRSLDDAGLYEGLAGDYEFELLEMLIKAFDRSFLSSHAAKLIMNSVYGASAIYADTDKGFMKEGDKNENSKTQSP